MVILGIDPGIGRTGWGAIEKSSGNIKLIAYGCIATSGKGGKSRRLKLLFDGLTAVIKKFRPELAGVESLFFNTNAKTALAVGEARGVALLALEKNKIRFREFTPLQIKQAVAGYGRATKIQVQKMVKALLGIDKIPRPDDAADALAAAIAAASVPIISN